MVWFAGQLFVLSEQKHKQVSCFCTYSNEDPMVWFAGQLSVLSEQNISKFKLNILVINQLRT